MLNTIFAKTSKTYLTGVMWFLCSLFSSAVNDVLVKSLSVNLPSFELAFFRFLFSTITLLPFVICYGIKTYNLHIQIIRGALLFLGMASWHYGLTISPVTTATILSFSMPLFILPLAVLFLNEKVIYQRWIVTIIGLVGIAVTLKPSSEDFNPSTLIFVISALLFSTLDIINKRIIVQESTISMLFYSALFTALFAFPFALLSWQIPSFLEIIYLMILGINTNLILFFILKAFAIADATALAPYRYLELLISSILAYFVFGTLPDVNTLYGTLILIPSTLLIIYSENKR